MKDFNIQVVVQPAQSPDLNVDDLAFFHSLQSDVSLVAKENRRELLEAVEDFWKEYPEEKNVVSVGLPLLLVPWRARKRG